MKFVSLFAGIGGIDLGLERAGHTCIGQVEIDNYATALLEKHWPNTPRIRDIRNYRGYEFGQPDMLTAGYPCQPFSQAGKRQGENDPRHLWPEVNRLIRTIRPQLILLENVPGHLTLGFDTVLGNLAENGYDAEWACIPAAGVGAPHLRYRLFILAYPRHRTIRSDSESEQPTETRPSRNLAGQETTRNVAHPQEQPQRSRLRPNEPTEERGGRPSHSRSTPNKMAHPNSTRSQGRYFSTERASQLLTRMRSESHTRNWSIEPDVGRVAHGISSRVDRLKTLGNAVVPQVAQYIGELINEAHEPP